VGGLLVHAMALLEPGEARQRQAHELLEQALLDLRLTVDSMDAVDDALPVRLARLRHRLQPVLDRRGMQMRWNVADPHSDTPLHTLPELPRGQPSQQLLAIVQEAVSNALQHAQAGTLWVVLEPLAQDRQADGGIGNACWELRVEDDGRGGVCDPSPGPSQEAQALQSRGLGLAGMQRRAHAMGATLTVLPRDGGGTVVRVRW
jgi:signal transduction histidine kinase